MTSVYNFVKLNDRCYKTLSKWTPKHNKPSTVRLLLNGKLDATYGSGGLWSWEGELKVAVTPPGSPPAPGEAWGTVEDARAVLQNRGIILFRDHYGDLYDVHIQDYEERSIHPDWSAASNTIYFKVRLVGVPH
jgi:hypothetical protein